MTESFEHQPQTAVVPGKPPAVAPPLPSLSTIMQSLDEAPHTADSQGAIQNQLIQVRLGLASGLFTALRVRHPPSAEHSLRVALGCSAWSLATDMSDQQRDELEVAALLHDIGKIGVPEHILRKPGALTTDQLSAMHQARAHGLRILSSCCFSDSIMHTVAHVGAWYDGSRESHSKAFNELPLAARMITIVDAFDSMTTDSAYRKALPRERALGELYIFAGTQFDAELVHHFTSVQNTSREKLDYQTVRRWLKALTVENSNKLWRLRLPDEVIDTETHFGAPFHQQLINNLQYGVVFVDSILTIQEWNRAAERLTGLSVEGVAYREWHPELINLRDERGRRLTEEDCPVRHSLKTGHKSQTRLLITLPDGNLSVIDLQVVPIFGHDRINLGATIVLRDAKSENKLQERVQTLHEKATRDPLTGVANRAEFDRFHAETVNRHAKRSAPCSLIICDIDRFKQVNDTHGHQAGDEALITFSSLLQRSCREGDHVARYGGEEFVIVCQDCGSSEATKLAEKIRMELSRSPLKELGGCYMTASFGVTELQPGDTPETMLRRADRGLLEAKDTGRNRVVELGSGMEHQKEESLAGRWRSFWSRPVDKQKLVESYLSTNVPLNVAAEKMRGFVADHDAEILMIQKDKLRLRITGRDCQQQRRHTDRVIPFLMDIEFSEQSNESAERTRMSQTVVAVAVRPVRVRDRRSNPVEDARNLIQSLKSYLMAQEYSPPS